MERDPIRTRTAEGRSRAQKRGQHTGRPPRLTAARQAEARRRRAEGATLAELGPQQLRRRQKHDSRLAG
jgi:DNA invertase Pin-like site-specific DNA recombinase